MNTSLKCIVYPRWAKVIALTTCPTDSINDFRLNVNTFLNIFYLFLNVYYLLLIVYIDVLNALWYTNALNMI